MNEIKNNDSNSSTKMNILKKYGDINYYPHILLSQKQKIFLKSKEEIINFIKSEMKHKPKYPNTDMYGYYFMYLILSAIFFPCIGNKEYLSAFIVIIISILYSLYISSKIKSNREKEMIYSNQIKYYNIISSIHDEINVKMLFINQGDYLSYILKFLVTKTV